MRVSPADPLVPGDLAYVPPPDSSAHSARWLWVEPDGKHARLAFREGAFPHDFSSPSDWLGDVPPVTRLARELPTLEAAQAWLRDRAEGKVCL